MLMKDEKEVKENFSKDTYMAAATKVMFTQISAKSGIKSLEKKQ